MHVYKCHVIVFGYAEYNYLVAVIYNSVKILV